MDIGEYTRFVIARDNPARTPMRAANLAANAELVDAIIGLCGEAGEIMDELKKHLMYNKPLDREKVAKECGDTFYYFVKLLDQLHLSIHTVMQTNVDKLTKRDKTDPNRYGDSQLVADLNAVLQEQLDKARQTNGL